MPTPTKKAKAKGGADVAGAVRAKINTCVNRFSHDRLKGSEKLDDKGIEFIVCMLQDVLEMIGKLKGALPRDISQLLVENFKEPSRMHPTIATVCFTVIARAAELVGAANSKSKGKVPQLALDLGPALDWIVDVALDDEAASETPSPFCRSQRADGDAELLEARLEAAGVLEELSHNDSGGRQALLALAGGERLWTATSACMSGAIAASLISVLAQVGVDADELRLLIGTDSTNARDFVPAARLKLATLHISNILKVSPKHIYCLGTHA